MTVHTIATVLIGTPKKKRLTTPAFIKTLADSIAEVGLLNPITVKSAGSEYVLIAGRHRLEAVRLLGWREIAATVVDLDDLDTRIAEIDENLIRSDLSALDRSEKLAKRKQLYEFKHPESRRGGDRGNQHTGGKRQTETISFSQDAAQKIGVTDRSIRQDTQIAESIPEDVREAIRETPLEDSKTDLLAMARLPEADQRAVVETVDLNDKTAVRAAISQRQPARSVREPEQTVYTTEVETTVEGFARAAVSLFTPAECRRLIRLIEEAS